MMKLFNVVFVLQVQIILLTFTCFLLLAIMSYIEFLSNKASELIITPSSY